MARPEPRAQDRRFYEAAGIGEDEGGFTILLDGRPVRTPGRQLLVLPSEPLAEAVAAEWAAQGEELRPESLRLNRMAATAVDLTEERAADARAQLLGFADTDLVCYRAEGPDELVARQRAQWDPPLAWLEAELGAGLRVQTGLMPISQPEEALAAIERRLAAIGDWRLMGVHAASTALGSLVLTLMLEAGALEAEAAVEASLVDERYTMERWGKERDALNRQAELSAEVLAAARWLALLARS